MSSPGSVRPVAVLLWCVLSAAAWAQPPGSPAEEAPLGPPELPREPFGPPFPWRPWVAGVLLTAGVLGVVVILRRRPAAPGPETPAEAPEEAPAAVRRRTRQALDRVRQGPLENPAVRAAITVELADHLREDLHRVLGIGGPHLTTPELQAEARLQAGASGAAPALEVLQVCDASKFAGRTPGPVELRELLRAADGYLDATRAAGGELEP